MRSEFQFFMTPDDESELVEVAQKMIDSIDRDSDIQWLFRVGDSPIQLLRSYIRNGELISGRISIATSGFGIDYKSGSDGESVYKRLRSWLKKTYSNGMTCRNVRIDNSRMDIRCFWVSPRVIRLIQADSSLTLKQVPKAPVVFELKNQEAEQAAT
jgi:hypothetical protein